MSPCSVLAFILTTPHAIPHDICLRYLIVISRPCLLALICVASAKHLVVIFALISIVLPTSRPDYEYAPFNLITHMPFVFERDGRRKSSIEPC